MKKNHKAETVQRYDSTYLEIAHAEGVELPQEGGVVHPSVLRDGLGVASDLHSYVCVD